MEVREELDKEKGMRNTLDYNSPNRDSSPKLSSPAGSEKLSHGNTNTIFNSPPQTLDHHNPYNLSYHLNRPNKPRRDHHHHHNPDLPSPDPVTTVSPASTTPISGGPNLRTPLNAAVAGGAPATPPTRYRECLRNHAASSGGHVLDGCGEFMPSGEEGSAEALKCAACECHRNFHRKEIEGESLYYAPNYRDSSRRNSLLLPPQHYAHPPHPHPHHSFALHGVSANPASGARPIPPVMMAFGGGGRGGGIATESSSEDLNVFQSNYGGGRLQQGAAGPGEAASRKRFRTKFNQEQKEKMTEFAEKLGWRIQKHDEQEVQEFCSEVGVKRQVFKVWMHNNKQAMKKKQM